MFSSTELSSYRPLKLQRSPIRRILAQVLFFTAWTLIFALIYAQSPLYTSNQNQYFLHGLANADYGFLKNDWLANTLDPTPAFSLLVSLTYRIFHTGFVFYLYYAILLGIYLMSLSGIGLRLYELTHPTVRLVYLALLVVIHSAGMRFFLSRAIGPEWTYLLEGGLANQRVLGVVFQPSTFGVLLLFSIYLFLKGNSYLPILPLALAVIFHPTYLLTAGLITLAYMLAIYRETRNPLQSLSIGVLALLFVSPILFYVYQTFGYAPAETAAQARDILVHFRIPHHAVISEWFGFSSILQIALMLVAAYLVRSTRLFTVMAVSILLASVLTIVQAITQEEALALLFPWRISNILVPLSVAILTAVLVKRGFERFSSWAEKQESSILLACRLLLILAFVVGIARAVRERQLMFSGEDRALMGYVSAEKQPQDVYLIPIKMQEFRLATGAPIYVDFKSIPYQDAEVLEWYRRIKLADRFYNQPKFDCAQVDAFAAEGVTHIVSDFQESTRPCHSLRLEYKDGGGYRLYSIHR